MQYCYPVGGATEAAPTYTTTSLPVNYETNAYAAYGQYDINGTSYYQDPSIYYEQIPEGHYSLQGNMVQNNIASESVYTESQSYGTPEDSNSYYSCNYQTFTAADHQWPTATDSQEATPATAYAPQTPTSTNPAPTTPSTPIIATLTPRQTPVHFPESAFCSSPTLTSPIPRNFYFSPNHFFRMVEQLQDESHALDGEQTESRPSSSEDEVGFDLKAERNKKVGELLNDNEIKNRFSKVSNDCTSLFKILDRLTNTREDELLSLANQGRTISETLTGLSPNKSRVVAKDEKIHCYTPVDETKYPSHYESPVFYDVPEPHQVECEKLLQNEATKKISKRSRNLEVTQKQAVRVSHSYEHFPSRKLEIEKKKRNAPTASKLQSSKEKLKAHSVNNLLEFNEGACVSQIVGGSNSMKMNLAYSEAVCDKIPKANEKATPRKESDSLAKMYRDNPVPSNTQLRADVRAILKKFKLKAKDVAADTTYKKIRLKKGPAKKCVLGSNLPNLPLSREVHPTQLTKKVRGPKASGFLPPISGGECKQLPNVAPRQKAQNTETRLKDSEHSSKTTKDSSPSKLPQVKKAPSNSPSVLPAKKEVPLSKLHPIQKEKHVRRKRISSATIARTLKKPLPPIDVKLQKRRPFK